MSCVVSLLDGGLRLWWKWSAELELKCVRDPQFADTPWSGKRGEDVFGAGV